MKVVIGSLNSGDTWVRSGGPGLALMVLNAIQRLAMCRGRDVRRVEGKMLTGDRRGEEKLSVSWTRVRRAFPG